MLPPPGFEPFGSSRASRWIPCIRSTRSPRDDRGLPKATAGQSGRVELPHPRASLLIVPHVAAARVRTVRFEPSEKMFTVYTAQPLSARPPRIAEGDRRSIRAAPLGFGELSTIALAKSWPRKEPQRGVGALCPLTGFSLEDHRLSVLPSNSAAAAAGSVKGFDPAITVVDSKQAMKRLIISALPDWSVRSYSRRSHESIFPGRLIDVLDRSIERAL